MVKFSDMGEVNGLVARFCKVTKEIGIKGKTIPEYEELQKEKMLIVREMIDLGVNPNA